MKRYWKDVKSIARDKGVSIRKARKAWRHRYWKVVIRTKYGKGLSRVSIQSVQYIKADSRNDAMDEAYQNILNHFDRDEGDFIPRHRFRVSAFKGYEKERGWLKWKHQREKKFQRASL